MKKTTILLFFVFITLLMSFPYNSFAMDTTRMNLPEGAIARFGKGIINEMVYSPNDKYLAVAASIGIWIYDMETYQEMALLTGPKGHTDSIVFSPDGKTIISGSRDGAVYFWDTITRKLNKTLTTYFWGVDCVTLTHDGNTLAICGSTAEGMDPTINLWNANTGKLLKEFAGPYSPFSVCFSPNGKTLVSGDTRRRNGISVWNVNTGELIKDLTGHEEFESISSVVFSPDGNIIASASADKTVRLWSPHTGLLLQTLKHTAHVNDVIFSADGKTLTSAGNDGIRFWNSHTAELINFIEIPAVSVVFSPDGKTFVSGSSDGIRVWDAHTKELLKTIEGYSDSVNSVVYSPDGNTIISGNRNNTIRVWDANTSRVIKTLTGPTDSVTSVAYSPDGNTIAIGSYDNTIRLWDAHTYVHRKTLNARKGSVSSIDFNPDGDIIVCDGWNEILIFDVHTGELLKTFAGHSRYVNKVAFSPDGNKIAASGSSVLELFDANSGETPKTFTERIDAINSILFILDGNMIITGGFDHGEEGAAFGRIDLWHVNSGEHLKTIEMEGFNGVTDIALRPDGNILVSGDMHYRGLGGEIHVWKVNSFEHIKTIEGHASSVESLAFSPDGKTLASGGRDGTILLWDFSGIP